MVTDNVPPIVQPSACLKKLFFNLKVQSVISFINNLVKIDFLAFIFVIFDINFISSNLNVVGYLHYPYQELTVGDIPGTSH